MFRPSLTIFPIEPTLREQVRLRLRSSPLTYRTTVSVSLPQATPDPLQLHALGPFSPRPSSRAATRALPRISCATSEARPPGSPTPSGLPPGSHHFTKRSPKREGEAKTSFDGAPPPLLLVALHSRKGYSSRLASGLDPVEHDDPLVRAPRPSSHPSAASAVGLPRRQEGFLPRGPPPISPSGPPAGFSGAPGLKPTVLLADN